MKIKFLGCIQNPDLLTTETDSANRWNQEKQCNCTWVIEEVNTRMRRIQKRQTTHHQQVLHEQQQQKLQTLSREQLDGWQSSSIITHSSDEDDEFLVKIIHFIRCIFKIVIVII